MTCETESEVKVGTLTKEDIKAFKIADAVGFTWEGGKSRDLTPGVIRLTKRRSGEGWTNAESDYDIKAMGHLTRYKNDEYTLNSDAQCRSFHSSLKYTPEIQTVIQLMRVGDVIQMKWVAENNTENYRKVGYHCDQLFLVLLRGRARYEFMIDYYVGPNNSGRLCR